MATYATPAELRLELGLDADDTGSLPDATAERLIEQAERRIDRIAGPLPVDPSTGLKYVPAVLDSPTTGTTRAGKLSDATVVIAAALKGDPAAFDPPAADKITGPDFSREGIKGMSSRGQSAMVSAAALLDAVGLRNLTATTR